MYEMSAREKKQSSERRSRARAEERAERATDQAAQARELAESAAERAAEMAREKVEQAAERAAERARQKAEEAAERAAERAREKAEQAAERAAERAREKAEGAAQRAIDRAGRAVERAASRRPAEGPIWFRQQPASRRPAHTRTDIARAALEIADSEGFDAVSMRRVAQRLGAGTMTLYHYVRNKDELVTLMNDFVMGEILVPEEDLADDWRAALTQIATRTRAAFASHPWIFEHPGGARLGPNAMRHIEQSLAAVAGLGLDRVQMFEIIGQVDDYVAGFSLHEAEDSEQDARGWAADIADFLHRETDPARYPLIRSFLGDDARAAIEETIRQSEDGSRFERGLRRLLDGIEASLPS